MAGISCSAKRRRQSDDSDCPSSWSDLPLDVVATMLSNLPTAGDVVRATLACKRFLEAFSMVQSLNINGSQEALSSNYHMDDVEVCRLILRTNGLRMLKVMEIGCYFPASGMLGLLWHLRPALETLWWGPAYAKKKADKHRPHPSKPPTKGDSELFLQEVSSMERLEKIEAYSLSFTSNLSFKASSFKSLRSLGLTNVTLESESIRSLLSSTRKLEALHMQDCVFGINRDASLAISSDSLTSLTVWMSECVRNIKIENKTATRLEALHLSIPHQCTDVWELLGGPFPNLRSATMCEGVAVSGLASTIIEAASGLRHVAIGSWRLANGLALLSRSLLSSMEQRLPSLTRLEIDSVTLDSFSSDLDVPIRLSKLKQMVLWVAVEENGTVKSNLDHKLLNTLTACTELQSLEVYVWARDERKFRFEDFSRFLCQMQRRFPRAAINQYVKKDYGLGQRQL